MHWFESISNMHSPPTRKLGKWWQMWYDDFGFYRFTSFYHIHGLPEISPHLPLTRLLMILIIHAAWCITHVGIGWKLHQETAINRPLYHQRVVETIPHGRFTIGYTTWLINPWQRLDQRSGCVHDASPIPAKPHKSTSCPVTSPFGKGQSDPPHSPP